VCAMTNVVGGFLITDRMLKMFRREEKPATPPGGVGSGSGSGEKAGGKVSA
jgi:NAD/NADP transhydrogenase alpha subunit